LPRSTTWKQRRSPEEPGAEWILLYDFKETKPDTKFWTNLSRARLGVGQVASMNQEAILLVGW